MPDQTQPKKKRAAKRYPYVQLAQCEFEGRTQEVCLLNISTSGIQLAARSRIESQNAIRVHWNDTQFGSFDITLLIAREVQSNDINEYQFYYGAQYFNLSAEVKTSLLLLLKDFSKKEKDTLADQIQKSGHQILLDVLDQGLSFLKEASKGEKIPALLHDTVKLIGENEIKVLGLHDETSICIQNLALLSFHCQIFKLLAGLMKENQDIVDICSKYINIGLSKITEVESESEKNAENLFNNKDKLTEKEKIAQRSLNESINRLFYTKQEMVISLMETCEGINSTSIEFRGLLAKILWESQQIQEANKTNQTETAQAYQRRSNLTKEYSRADAILEIALETDKKPRYYTWGASSLLILLIFSIFISNIKESMQVSSIKDEMGLTIKVKNIERLPSQIEITVSDSSWNRLTEEQKGDVYRKIVSYLQKNRGGLIAVLFNEDRSLIITTLYKSTKSE